MDVDKEVLISRVFLKSVIWDRRLMGHANRKIVDKAWQELALEMDVEDEGLLRKKWKYLRDQFAVEMGKFPRSGNSGDCPESKWPYFKSLMFLSGIVKPRTMSSNLKSKNSSENQDENAELVTDSETQPTEDAQEMESQVSDIPLGFRQIQPDDSIRTNCLSSETFSRKRKLTDGNSDYNQQILSLDEKKASLLECVINECRFTTDNDDELFFRSILPHVNKIPQHMKLRFRNRVQTLVDEFAYGSLQNKPIQSTRFNSQPRECIQRSTPENISSPGSTHSCSDSSSNHYATGSAEQQDVCEDLQNSSSGALW